MLMRTWLLFWLKKALPIEEVAHVPLEEMVPLKALMRILLRASCRAKMHCLPWLWPVKKLTKVEPAEFIKYEGIDQS